MLAVEWNLANVTWAMVVFFFWVTALWVFISIFGDVVRRRDLSGVAKAGWIFLLFVLPFLGALLYMIARPSMTEQDREDVMRIQEARRRIEGYSYAEEIERLATLRDSGELTTQQFESLKHRAMLEV